MTEEDVVQAIVLAGFLNRPDGGRCFDHEDCAPVSLGISADRARIVFREGRAHRAQTDLVVKLGQSRRQSRDFGWFSGEEVLRQAAGGSWSDPRKTLQMLEQDPDRTRSQIHQPPPSGRTAMTWPPMIDRASATPGSFSASAMSPLSGSSGRPGTTSTSTSISVLPG